MRNRAAVISSWLLIGTFAVLVTGSAFVAQRSCLLYAYVGVTLLAGALLVVIRRRCNLDWRLVLVVALVLRAAVFWMPPTLSDDAYRYVWDGDVQHEGYNPYLYRPSDPALEGLREGELFERLNSPDFFSVYPPFSQALFYLATSSHATGWRTKYYLSKLIILFIEMAGLLALVRISSPGLSVLYAWNPVVVIEVAGQGHTEGAAAGLLLLALWLVRSRRHGQASAAVAAAGLVKLFPFLLLPLFWRRGRWIAVAGGMSAAVVIAVPYFRIDVIPHFVESLGLYVRYFEFNAGPYYAVKGVLQFMFGQDLGKLIGPLFGAAFGLVLVGIYRADFRQRLSLEQSILAILGFFLLFSTTVHPWYVVPLLAIVAMQRPVRWHWYWFSVLSSGTYLLYVGGPYWLFVVLAWLVWALLAGRFHFDPLLQWVQRSRGSAKFRMMREWLGPGEELRILDLGAGEGYVGLEASLEPGITVVLADVVDMNRTELPFRLVSEDSLDFETDSFDYVLLCYVLHHAEKPDRVLAEAVRVSRRGVIVMESVYESEGQRRLLTFLDRLANRVRSRGLMRRQEEHLHFRTKQEWIDLTGQLGLKLKRERSDGHWIHRKAMLQIHE